MDREIRDRLAAAMESARKKPVKRFGAKTWKRVRGQTTIVSFL